MKIQRIIGIIAGSLMLISNITPILAKDVSYMNTEPVMQLCQEEISDSANTIYQYIDEIKIEKSTPIQEMPSYYNEAVYTYANMYTYETEAVYEQQVITVEEFMAMYGQFEEIVQIDTSAEEAAYQQALTNYNLALAQYETAGQLVETTSEIEIEITEEVTDEEGNVTEVTHTEIQTITETVASGDVEEAKAALDAAESEFNDARQALETAQNSISTESSVSSVPETVLLSQEPVFIDEDVVITEDVTSTGSGTCGDNVTWTLDDDGLLTIFGTGAMDDKSRTAWQENIKSVVINEGITRIGDYAFYKCSNITEVVIPGTVTEIGNASFYQCTSLESVTLPDTVKYMGDYSFSWDSNIKDVYYLGSEKTFAKYNLYQFPTGATIHYLGKPFVFTDVPENEWYYSSAKESYEIGLISGTSATTFSPMQEMTRAMVITILWRMEGQPKVAFNDKFSDVSSKQWYANAVSWAVETGVVHGYGDGTFKPDAAVTREQVAVMLANYAQYRNCYTPGTKKLNTYPDGTQVSSWAVNGMKWAVTEGIVSGNGAGYLNPKKSATRAEGATMLLRMNNWLDANDALRIAEHDGIIGFVQWLVDKGYATGSEDAALIQTLKDNLDKYNLDASAPSSPFNLDNAVKSINLIKQCNELRALDDGKSENDLQALQITNYMMLVAAIQNCASWDLFEEGHWDHSKLYNVGENIARNAPDPFNGWYTQEKQNYEENNGGETGHYLNIIKSSYVITGFSWGYKKHSNQVFSLDTDNATKFTADEYLALLNQYRNEIGI